MGTELMMIEPEHANFVGLVKIPQGNIGKLKKRQIILIKLDGFPYREHGMVNGVFSRFSATPGKYSSFWDYVNLPRKLETQHHKVLPYRNGLKGQAEIVTTERRLIEKFISTVRNGKGW